MAERFVLTWPEKMNRATRSSLIRSMARAIGEGRFNHYLLRTYFIIEQRLDEERVKMQRATKRD